MKPGFWNVAALVALLLLPLYKSAHAQDGKQARSDFLPSFFQPDETFSVLKKQRRAAATEIEKAESDIRRLDAELASLVQRAEFDDRRLIRIEEDLEQIEIAVAKRSRSDFRPKPVASGRPSSFEEYILSLPDAASVDREKKQRIADREDIQKRAARIKQVEKDIATKSDAVPALRDKLFDLEESISDRLDTSSNQYFYRAGVSVIFAAIVFFLVLKFFRVVDSNARVKESIFTGDSGIQFITLFSIVIAVILFGILGILGANELSALLGGLSGYILGKSNSSTGRTEDAAEKPGRAIENAAPT